MKIDLNSDLGENIGNDKEIIKYIDSANIACGFHAGDPLTMKNTVQLALDNNVKIGAHPGFFDKKGFGRKKINLSNEEVRSLMIYQIGALNGFIKVLGGKLNHVKPHGALYNMAAKDYKLSKLLAETVYDIDPDIVFVGLSNSFMIKAAKDTGLKVMNEVFADRAYNSDGTLVSRDTKGAILHDIDICVDRVVEMVERKIVTTINNEKITIEADTICLHGDNIEAIKLSRALSNALKKV